MTVPKVGQDSAESTGLSFLPMQSSRAMLSAPSGPQSLGLYMERDVSVFVMSNVSEITHHHCLWSLQSRTSIDGEGQKNRTIHLRNRTSGSISDILFAICTLCLVSLKFLAGLSLKKASKARGGAASCTCSLQQQFKM